MTGDHGEVGGGIEIVKAALQRSWPTISKPSRPAGPPTAEWLARYPEWAKEIAVFLDDQDRLLRLTEPLRPIDRPTTGFVPDTELSEQVGRLRVGDQGPLSRRL